MVFLLGLALLDAQIEEIIKEHGLEHASIGIHIADAQSGQSIYGRNEDSLLVPASNQKIITAAYAMHRLGPDATFKTSFWKTGNGIAAHFSGDPTLTAENLQDASRRLNSPQGTRMDLYLAFNEPFGRAWELDDVGASYLPVPSAANFNEGVFALTTSRDGVQPLPSYLGIQTRYNSSSGPLNVRYEPEEELIVVTGQLPPAGTTIGTYSFVNPSASVGRIFNAIPIVSSSSPPNSEPLHTFSSPPVRQLISTMLTRSQNHYAECLLLGTAAGSLETSVRYPDARADITEFLTETVGLDGDSFFVADGSGLSRHNLITPRGLTQILGWSRTAHGINSVTGLLPASGSGTLGSRLQELRYRGKTGTLFATSALTGELIKASGQRYLVSVIINHAPLPARELKNVEDKILRSIAAAVDYHQKTTLSQIWGQGDAESSTGPAAGHWIHRPLRYSDSAFSWIDRRTQPSHETSDRIARAAVRGG